MTRARLALAWLAVAGCAGAGELPATTRAMIRDDLRRAAHAGYPAQLVVGGEVITGERGAGVEATTLRFGERSIALEPSRALAGLLGPGEAEAHFARWVEPFFSAGDRRGAARAASRAYLELLRAHTPALREVPLPPILPPDPQRREPWPLGWRLASGGLALAASVLVLRQRRRG